VAYARSSVKLVAAPEPLLLGASAAATAALDLVDLSQEPHPAPHPRQGAVDMISFMPLSELRADAIRPELDECDELAWRLGELLGSRGCPVLMYGERKGRTLLDTRRGTSFFASVKPSSAREARTKLELDFGAQTSACAVAPATAADAADAAATTATAAASGESGGSGFALPQRLGVSIIGVQPYVTNFNVVVDGASLAECKLAADAVRSSLGVQVMALPHADGMHEVGCNLQARDTVDSPPTEAVLRVVRDALPESGRIVRSYVVGLTPDEARRKAQERTPE